MKYLLDLNFTDEDLFKLEEQTDSELHEELDNSQKLVRKNIQSLVDLGIDNYKDLFLAYPEMFLMDNEQLTKTLNKYDTADLIEHLKTDINVFPQL